MRVIYNNGLHSGSIGVVFLHGLGLGFALVINCTHFSAHTSHDLCKSSK